MPVILAFGRLRQEVGEFEISLGYREILSLKKKFTKQNMSVGVFPKQCTDYSL
jgi:hypothetical protein